MTRLLMLVEGQSEEIFVKRVLAPFLEQRGVFVQPPVVLWTKRLPSGGGYRGGISNWNQVRRSLLPLTHDTEAYVTTLLDFYGLPNDFPGYANAKAPGNPRDHVRTLQDRFAAEIGHPRFIPFLALHEFEAWVFTAPEIVANHFGNAGLARQLERAVAEAGEPEFINHGEATHPKARLQGFQLGYKETSDGPTLLEKIGIQAIRQACGHFSDWLDRLEALAMRVP